MGVNDPRPQPVTLYDAAGNAASSATPLVTQEPSITTKNATLAVADATDSAPGRYFRVNATVAGDVTVKFADATTEVISVGVGYALYPFAVVRVTASTATATYANLK